MNNATYKLNLVFKPFDPENVPTSPAVFAQISTFGILQKTSSELSHWLWSMPTHYAELDCPVLVVNEKQNNSTAEEKIFEYGKTLGMHHPLDVDFLIESHSFLRAKNKERIMAEDISKTHILISDLKNMKMKHLVKFLQSVDAQ